MQHFLGGVHSVKKMLECYPKHVKRLFMVRGNQHQQWFVAESKRLGIVLEFCTKEQLDLWVSGVNHQGIAAAYEQLPSLGLEDLVGRCQKREGPPVLLILDRIQDPQNLGACIRSAACFGVDGIIIPKDNAAGLTPTVLKIAVGACALVPVVRVTNLVRAMQYLKKNGFWLYGTAEKAKDSIVNCDVDLPIAWVMGNETKGLSSLVMKHCDVLYSIDTAGFSTLNIATSTGICLYQTFSKRLNG